MAHLFRPKYTKPVPKNAEIVTRKGVRYATWNARGGRIVSWPLTEDGTRYIAESSKWYVRYTDHTGAEHEVPVSSDRRLAERKKFELEDRVEKIRHGVLPSGSQASDERQPIPPLLDRWERAIEAGGATSKQSRQSRRRVEVVFEQAGIDRPGGIVAEAVVDALAHFRRHGVHRAEGDRRKPKPLSVRTSNHFLKACRAFVGWLIDSKVMQADPLARVRQLNPEGRETYQRRALAVGELDRLMTAAVSRKARCDLAGPDRAAVYYVAFYSGYRLNELAVLTLADFRLDVAAPCVVLSAKHTKNKREARQYLPAHAAVWLRTYLAGRGAGRVWSASNFFAGTKAAGVLRRDLIAAGIPVETPDGRIDFHALRGSYITALAVAGVPMPVVQRAARHSDPRLTMKAYVKLTDEQMAAEMQKLPPS